MKKDTLVFPASKTASACQRLEANQHPNEHSDAELLYAGYALGLQAELISVRIYEDGTITDRKVGH